MFVAASISIPPADAVKVKAPSASPWVLVITIVSVEPISVVKLIAEAVSSFDTRATWPPEIFISLFDAASIYIPPADAVKLKAPSSVPLVFLILIYSSPGVLDAATLK